jgi:Uma2 family endonuclease
LDEGPDIPILYEDEEEGDMGETNQHVDTDEILHLCLRMHFADRPRYRVYANMNLYYRKKPRHSKTKSPPYVSPDVMVVEPFLDLGEDVRSYTIDAEGPPLLLTAETLSRRSAEQKDLKEKKLIYAKLQVPEYLLIDVTGRYLKRRLLLKRLRTDGKWEDTQDADGGITSRLGFRVLIEEDGRIRLYNAATSKPYVRPDEALRVADSLSEKVKQLETELTRLRQAEKPTRFSTRPNGRRKK